MYAKLLQSCLTVRSHGWYPARLFCPWDSPGKNTGVGCPSPGDLPDPGMEPTSFISPTQLLGPLSRAPPGKTGNIMQRHPMYSLSSSWKW